MRFLNLNKGEDRGKIYWKNDWIEFHPYFRNANINFERAGYFDSRPQVNLTITTFISLIGIIASPLLWDFSWAHFLLVFLFLPWGQIYLHIPYDTGIDECESDRWGFYFYGEGTRIPETLVICKGKKTKHISLPWSLEWVRTSYMLENGEWVHDRKGNRGKNIDYHSDEFKESLFTEKHGYLYTLNNGQCQERDAKVTIVEREWRPIWFRWTPIFSKKRRVIEIEFDREVGERTGSWKGGCIGCSWEIFPNETPLMALRRMERVRKF